MRNIFLKKSYTECTKKLFPDSSLQSQSKVLYCLFLLYVQIEGYWNILKLSYRPLAFIKTKERSGTSPPASFFVWFLKKNISHTIFWLTDQISIAWLSLLLEILGNMWIVIFRFQGYDLMINFQVNPIYLIKPFFLHDQKVHSKSQDKNLHILRTKRASKMK